MGAVPRGPACDANGEARAFARCAEAWEGVAETVYTARHFLVVVDSSFAEYLLVEPGFGWFVERAGLSQWVA